MRTLASLCALLLAAAVLAGCTDGGDAGPGNGNGQPPPAAGTGVISGVVVDDTVTPVTEARVEVLNTDHEDTTDEEGRFRFTDLEPGAYFVRVSKPGFTTVQQSVEVVADVSDPPVLRVFLERDPESAPYVMAFVWNGFLECGVGTPGGSVNPCFLVPDSENVFTHEIDSTVPDFIQSEMVWESSSGVSQALWYSHFVSGATLPDDYSNTQGPSPLLLQSDRDVLEARGVGPEHMLNLRVFPGGPDDEPVTVFVSQPFTVYSHVFYNQLPEDGWRFSEDGHPPNTV